LCQVAGNLGNSDMQSASERECMHIAPLSVQNLKDPLGVTNEGHYN